jgi:hypothetical protein
LYFSKSIKEESINITLIIGNKKEKNILDINIKPIFLKWITP